MDTIAIIAVRDSEGVLRVPFIKDGPEAIQQAEEVRQMILKERPADVSEIHFFRSPRALYVDHLAFPVVSTNESDSPTHKPEPKDSEANPS